MEIKLGQKVRDIITGFEGIVLVTEEWLTGCKQVGVKPQFLIEGCTVDIEMFDVARLEVIDEENILAKKGSVGGPQEVGFKSDRGRG